MARACRRSRRSKQHERERALLCARTIAQCAAALAALIGFLGLWRLDRLTAERDKVMEDLVKGLITANILDARIALSAEEVVRTTRRIVEHPSTAQQQQAKEQIESPLARWEATPSEQRRLMRALCGFLGVTLAILVLAVIGLIFVDQLKTCAVTPWLIGFASVGLGIGPAYVVWQAAQSSRRGTFEL